MMEVGRNMLLKMIALLLKSNDLDFGPLINSLGLMLINNKRMAFVY